MCRIDTLGKVGVNTDGVKLDAKTTKARWSNTADGVTKFEEAEKKAKKLGHYSKFFANTDAVLVVVCECKNEDSKNCTISCNLSAFANIYLNQNRSKEKTKNEWRQVYGHEQSHISSFKKYISDTFVPALKGEDDTPCSKTRADELTNKYTQKWIDWKGSGYDHKGDKNATSESIGAEEMRDPIKESPEVPEPLGGWK